MSVLNIEGVELHEIAGGYHWREKGVIFAFDEHDCSYVIRAAGWVDGFASLRSAVIAAKVVYE